MLEISHRISPVDHPGTLGPSRPVMSQADAVERRPVLKAVERRGKQLFFFRMASNLEPIDCSRLVA